MRVQGWKTSEVKIFINFKDDSVVNLVHCNAFQKKPQIAEDFFIQMLKVLNYLVYHRLLHWDIKSDNILYVLLNRKYHFQLTDFSLCNVAMKAMTYTGSPPYMTSEILCNKGYQQTSTIDIWLLFVIMIYVLNVDNYCHKNICTVNDIIKAAQTAAGAEVMTEIKDMVIINPAKCASATEMLVKFKNEQELSTSHEKISCL